MTDAPTPSPEELLDLARTIALDAAELVARRRAEGVSIAASKSSQEDVVTFADRESETLIRTALAEARPDDAFFGEESGGAEGSSGITWVVDPIDGTVNYLYGIPAYAVSIAAVEGGIDADSWRVLAGVVVNPALGEVFSASLGGGAYLGDRRLHCNTSVEPSQALLGTGFSYTAEVRARQGQFVAGMLPIVRDIRRAGAAALDLCSVAAGRLDAYAERGLNPWDYAAGSLIAREAGAWVGGFDGAPESGTWIMAADPELLGQLEPTIREHYDRAGLGSI
ncbi:inositol monophosphatase [Cnuibacter physcomitrellae]|uniref:Inositol-1-monophosphatase n=1 Tax=Cnuibacter physcomitrellae TaxID=1619308 RepID=A0A1X9LLZ5_9MICO|nr:inositol monophosphatase family protein [Cnuibacter physcomitrellae]ARJ06236.1 inositol monophosphatase [Cnuibacter physcomitrellae]MCS5495971.1 inositol monophosphatase [Cnuibacter physcomitrellae]GGI37526.1 inositol monophosphatase [Cnuibacter physcomitrellae]